MPTPTPNPNPDPNTNTIANPDSDPDPNPNQVHEKHILLPLLPAALLAPSAPRELVRILTLTPTPTPTPTPAPALALALALTVAGTYNDQKGISQKRDPGCKPTKPGYYAVSESSSETECAAGTVAPEAQMKKYEC